MNNLFIISISFSPDISKNNSLTNSPSLACLIVSVSVALHRLISTVNLFRSLSFDLFFFFGFSSCCKLILGDPGADIRGKAKFKQAEKYGTKESKERPEEPLKTIGNLRITTTTLSTTTGSEIPCTAQARLTNFVVVVSSTTPNTVESRCPAVHKLRQV